MIYLFSCQQILSTRFTIRFIINREELQPSELHTTPHASKAFFMVLLPQDRYHRPRQRLLTLMAQVPCCLVCTFRAAVELPVQVKVALRKLVLAVGTAEARWVVLLVAGLDVPACPEELPAGRALVAFVGLKALWAPEKPSLLEVVLYKGFRALRAAEALLVAAGPADMNEVVGRRLFAHKTDLGAIIG